MSDDKLSGDGVNQGKVVNLKAAARKTGRRVQGTKPKRAELFRELSDVINRHETDNPPLGKSYYSIEIAPGVRRVASEYAPGCIAFVDKDALVNDLVHYTAEKMSGSGLFALTVRDLKDAVDYWIAETAPIPRPKMLAEKDDEALCFMRMPFNFRDDSKALTPTFDEFLSRTDCPDQIRAFIGSCFVDESNRQQYLWLFGDGGDGKGSFVNAIGTLFGEFFAATTAPKNGAMRFWTNSIIDKRFVVFPDNNNYRFPNEGIFKSCTGDDKILCEVKNGKIYSDYMRCKFIFLSNKKPDIDSARSSQRRAIFSVVRSPKGTVNELTGEYAAMLAGEAIEFCKKCTAYFLSKYKLNETIAVDLDNLSLLTDASEEYFEYIFAECFVAASGAETQAEDVMRKLQSCKLDTFMRHDFLAFMERVKKVSYKRTKTRRLYVGIAVKHPTAAVGASATLRPPTDGAVPAARRGTYKL